MPVSKDWWYESRLIFYYYFKGYCGKRWSRDRGQRKKRGWRHQKAYLVQTDGERHNKLLPMFIVKIIWCQVSKDSCHVSNLIFKILFQQSCYCEKRWNKGHRGQGESTAWIREKRDSHWHSSGDQLRRRWKEHAILSCLLHFWFGRPWNSALSAEQQYWRFPLWPSSTPKGNL